MTVNCYWQGRAKYRSTYKCNCFARYNEGNEVNLSDDLNECEGCPFQFDGFPEDYKIVAEFKNTTAFKNIITTAAAMTTDFTFQCEENGIRILNTDSGRTSYLRMFFHKDDLESYSWSLHHALTITSDDFAKIIKLGKTYDKLKITFKLRSVIITYVNTENSKIKEFELNSVEHPDEDSLISNAVVNRMFSEWAPTMTIKYALFNEIVEDLSIFGIKIKLNIDNDGITFTNLGYKGKGREELRKEIFESYTYNKGEISSNYMIELLLKTSNLVRVFKFVHISVNDEKPLLYTFDLDEMSFVQIIMAPCVEDDEDDIYGD